MHEKLLYERYCTVYTSREKVSCEFSIKSNKSKRLTELELIIFTTRKKAFEFVE